MASPPPAASATPPSSSQPSPPSSLSPPPSSNSPPPASAPPPSSPVLPPLPLLSPPPPPPDVPPPPVVIPPPPPPDTPPPSASPPPPALSPPPPALSPPPAATSSPPPPGSPPPSASPPPPGPPPAAAAPPTSFPPPPPSATPPTNSSPPPPSLPASPPNNSTVGTPPAPPKTPPPLPSASNPVAPANPISPSSNTSDVSITDQGQNSSQSSGNGGLKAGPAVGVALVTAFVLFSLVGLFVWIVRKRKKPAVNYHYEAGGFANHSPSPYQSSVMSESSYTRSPSAPLFSHQKSASAVSESMASSTLPSSTSWFSYEELYEVTDGFAPQNILGEGGFGCVYKGRLSDGREVAVKQLKVGSGQGEREFKAEVEIISRVHHRHLVSLVGYCISENHRLLVYDFVPNGTLESHLHGKGKPVMDWATRVKVAAGAARGIAYLHEDCHPRIIHRDIKTSNILLDSNFEAQVSDFGLARLAMDACTHVTTRVMGTFGYLAPEYASSGKLTERSDVFSYGVVLLELISGRKPVDGTRPLGDESLVEWARPLLAHAIETGEFGELPDPRLDDNYNEAEMFRMIEAAAACARHSAAMRPRMGKVVRVLDSLADVDLNNGVKPGQSEMFNVGQTADIRLFQRLAFGSQEFSTDYSQSNWSHQSDL